MISQEFQLDDKMEACTYIQRKNWKKIAAMTELAPGRIRVVKEAVNDGSVKPLRMAPSSQVSICWRPNIAQQANITRNTMIAQDKAANAELLIFLRNMRTGRTICRMMAKLPNTLLAVKEAIEVAGMQMLLP